VILRQSFHISRSDPVNTLIHVNNNPETWDYYNDMMSEFEVGDEGWNLNIRLEVDYTREDLERLSNSYRNYIP